MGAKAAANEKIAARIKAMNFIFSKYRLAYGKAEE
jgi:hypothetical protein